MGLLGVTLVMLWMCGKMDASIVDFYVGNGCFFARQHTLITEFEIKSEQRDAKELTAVAAYAGGRIPASGQLCYENTNGTDVYVDYGAAEVVALRVANSAQLQRALGVYFRTFVLLERDAAHPQGVWGRPDLRDLGPAYRALIGVPGGLDGPLGQFVRAANLHNMTLVAGNGSDADTLGTDTVYVMDSVAFPPLQAELCLQFHDDSQVKYSAEYHQLNSSLLESGRLHATVCPANFICGS